MNLSVNEPPELNIPEVVVLHIADLLSSLHNVTVHGCSYQGNADPSS